MYSMYGDNRAMGEFVSGSAVCSGEECETYGDTNVVGEGDVPERGI